MPTRKLLPILLLCFAGIVGCTTSNTPTVKPVALITGDDYCAAGDAAKISFKGSSGAKILWKAMPEKEELRMFELRDGDLLYLPNQCGVTNIVLVAISDNDGAMATHEIIVGPGPKPDPNPNPNPNPNPGPATGLKKLAIDLANTHITTDRVADGNKLGDAIAKVCANANNYSTPQLFREGVRQACHDALDIKVYDWEPVSAGIANAINNMVQQGKITTVADYAKAWAEVAEGFKSLQHQIQQKVTYNGRNRTSLRLAIQNCG